jgi:hypothetical protein
VFVTHYKTLIIVKKEKLNSEELTFGQEVKQWIGGHRRLVGVFVIINWF